MKKDQYYFDVLISCANYGCDAAKFLQETLKNFNPDSLTEIWMPCMPSSIMQTALSTR